MKAYYAEEMPTSWVPSLTDVSRVELANIVEPVEGVQISSSVYQENTGDYEEEKGDLDGNQVDLDPQLSVEQPCSRSGRKVVPPERYGNWM